MAKRSTRQVINARLRTAISLIEQAEQRLNVASGMYFEQGKLEGKHLDIIRQNLEYTLAALRQFRAAS